MDNKIDWRRKFSSRKLWLAVSLFVSGLIAHWVSQEVAVKVASDIMQAGAVVSYILAEGWTDATHKQEASQPAQTDAAPEVDTYGEGL